MIRPGASLVGILATAAVAQAQEMKPAPDYFVETIVATTTAENLAMACPSLSFELLQASRASGDVLAQLGEDGFDAKNLEATMQDPAERIRAAQLAFLEKHDLPNAGADYRDVCAAGLAEIAEGSTIGSFLVEISGDGAVDPTAENSGN